MATFPLYTGDQAVTCQHCGKSAGEARTGECLMLGDGFGNRRIVCDACGRPTFYDVTRSPQKAADHNAANAAYFATVKELNEVAASDGKVRRRPKPAVPSGSAFDLPGGSAFDLPTDLGSLITTELAQSRNANITRKTSHG